jgi:hypothetical protein
MNATAENGFLPAFTADQLVEVSAKASRKYVETLSQFCKGDFGAVEDHLNDLSQAFALGALEAAKRSEDGKAIRTMQWKYGEGYMLKRLHVILSDMVQAGKNIPIDHTGGAMANGEDIDNAEEAPGYVVEGDGAVTDSLVAMEDKAAAMEAFNALPAKFKGTLELSLLEGKSFKEVSKAFKITEMAARLRYFYGINKLKENYNRIVRRQFAA